MNILLLPSWYPSKRDDIGGSFFKEQASAFVKYYPDSNIYVSSVVLYPLTYKRPFFSLNELMMYRNNRKFSCQTTEFNLIESEVGSLTWSKKILNGNFSNLIRLHEVNLIKAIKKFGSIDIIHAHVSYPGGYIANVLSKKYHIPYVITEHMGPFPFKIYLNKDGDAIDEIKIAINEAQEVFAVSPSLAKEMEKYGFKEPLFIPNMVDEDFFQPSSHTHANKRFTFLTVARLVPLKGIEDLLNAIKKIILIRPNITFRIVGYGPKYKEYVEMAERFKISEYIEWLGKKDREEVLIEFQNCDAFVLPSHIETFGLVYAEAIACGKPIIATRCGGAECIINDINGVLINVGDTDGLIDSMLNIIDNYNNYDSKEIRLDFLNNFSKQRIIKILNERYINATKVYREK